MELTYSKWGMCAILFLNLATATELLGPRKRPETILKEVFMKPFMPSRQETASLECIRDSKIYLEALQKYTPWALQSE